MTPTPKRIKLSRRKGFDLQRHSRALNGLPCVNVARPGKWGNIHRIGYCPVCGVDHTRAEAVAEYEAEVSQLPETFFAELRGKNLACWCKAAQECHGDVLLRLAKETP